MANNTYKLPSLSADPQGVGAQRIAFDLFIRNANNATPSRMLELLGFMSNAGRAIQFRANTEGVSEQTKADVANFRARVDRYTAIAKANIGNGAQSIRGLVTYPVVAGEYSDVPLGDNGYKMPGISNATRQTVSDVGTAYRLASLLDVEAGVWRQIRKEWAVDIADSFKDMAKWPVAKIKKWGLGAIAVLVAIEIAKGE